MNLLEILKQFKLIEPDSAYSQKSKRMILAAEPHAPRGIKGKFVLLLRIIETGSAVALAGFFVLLITGAFSNSPYLAPVQYSVIDPNGLHAEAQAIDMQIQLANLHYPEAPASAESTPAADVSAKMAPLAASMAAVSSSPAAASTPAEAPSADSGAAAGLAASSTDASSSPSSTPSTTLSVDQALEQLSE